jgi:hypothetical protein
MKNKTTTFSIAAFMALALALTVPFTASAVEFVPVVDGSGSGTSESPIPSFVPSVDGSGSGSSESAIPAFVPTVDGSGSGTSEGSGSVFVPVVDGTGSSTSEGSGAIFIPTADESGSGTSEGTPLVFAPATTTSTSTEVVTETPAVTPVAAVSRSSSSRSGGRSGGTVAPLAILALADGASTTCPYINSFITINGANDAAEVARLQSFLNTSEGASLAITGIYDEATQNAVGVFQLKHSADILAPWNRITASNNVYLTTKKKVNEIVCGQEFALTAAELAEIAQTRDAVVNGTTAATGVIGSANSASTTLAAATSTGSTTNSNVAAAFFGGNFLSKFFNFVKGLFTGSN